MSLQDVEKKVLASAEEEAGQILDQAEAEAKVELERRGDALRDEQRRKISAAKGAADAGLERDVNTRRADNTMKILGAKNEVLDAIFDKARGRTLASEGFDYGFWLAKQVCTACEQGTGVMHCNARDRETVEAVVREAGTDEITVASENAAFQGGVLLVGESFDLDLTLDSALTDLRTGMIVSLAERLFADLTAAAPGDEAGG